MEKVIIINADSGLLQVGLLENGQLVEYFRETLETGRLVGNVYKGIVQNVLPGMQAAFIDIGLEKNAFLYAGDIPLPGGKGESAGNTASIRDLLKTGQQVMVQVMKEAFGQKGPRVTAYITLPGRYAVLSGMVETVGVSRKIEAEEERQRLEQIALSLCPGGMGLIIRTMAQGIGRDELEEDVLELREKWERLQNSFYKKGAPMLLHRDAQLLPRLVRDIFNESISKVRVNDTKVYHLLEEELKQWAPQLRFRVALEEGINLWQELNLESELGKALKHKVWLKSGGYLVLDQTEALTVIDVNSGKYVGATHLDDTVKAINMEAAKEIVRQLRLRNIGGMIVIDFIDMAQPEAMEDLLAFMDEELKKDRTKTTLVGSTKLGLVEMTRKKTSESLSEQMEALCPTCGGRGRVMSES